MIIKLKRLAVLHSVPFAHPNQQTLQSSEGSLELDTEKELVIAKLHKPHTHRGDTYIPYSNIAFFEPLVEKVEDPKPVPVVPPAAPAPVKSDVVKFVKDAKGNIVDASELAAPADPLVDAIAAADADTDA